jgi:hypothetical protein
MTHGELMPTSGGRHRGPVTLAEVVNALDLSRALPPTRPTSQKARIRRPGSRRPGDVDVADAHGEVARRHRPVLTDLSTASDRVSLALAALSAG